MTPYDAAMAGVIVLGLVRGAMRGVTSQLATVTSLVLGYLVAFPLSAQLAPRFPGEPVVARTLALLAVYAGVSAGVFWLAWMVRATLRRWRLEAYDRHLGMLLGGAAGAAVGVVATVFAVSLVPQARSPILTSPSGRVVAQVLDVVQGALPTEVRGVLAPFWEVSDPAMVPGGPGSWAEPEDPWDRVLDDGGARAGRAWGEAVETRGGHGGDRDGRDLDRR